MTRYSFHIISRVKQLRSKGKTFREINAELQTNIPKNTLSYWCKDCSLPPDYQSKIKLIVKTNITAAQIKAVQKNKEIRSKFFRSLQEKNSYLVKKIDNISTAKIALAMLCLGEASKSGNQSSFYLGNSDPKIIITFLKLLYICYPINPEKFRCTVQCRADQNPEELKKYWTSITHIPERLFYKPLIDPRTVGKPTRKKDYKGVLRIDYFDNSIRYELEIIASLLYNYLRLGPEV